MDVIKKIIEIIKSPLGSLAIRAIIPFAKMGIKWTPTKKDDYYLSKIVVDILEGQILGYELIGLPAPVNLQTALVTARQNLELIKKQLDEQKISKMKKK